MKNNDTMFKTLRAPEWLIQKGKQQALKLGLEISDYIRLLINLDITVDEEQTIQFNVSIEADKKTSIGFILDETTAFLLEKKSSEIRNKSAYLRMLLNLDIADQLLKIKI